MTRLASLGVLGAVLALFAGLFDAEVLWVPALGLVALSVGLAVSVLLAARGARVQRDLEAGRVVECEPLHVDLRVRAGLGRIAGRAGGPGGSRYPWTCACAPACCRWPPASSSPATACRPSACPPGGGTPRRAWRSAPRAGAAAALPRPSSGSPIPSGSAAASCAAAAATRC